MKIHCDNCGWEGSEEELICPYDTFDERCPNCNDGWQLIEVEDILGNNVEEFMWEFICKLFKQKPKQYTFCYCDCGNELVSNHKSLDDNDGVVEYICGKCGKKTVWLFDIAPAPIRAE